MIAEIFLANSGGEVSGDQSYGPIGPQLKRAEPFFSFPPFLFSRNPLKTS